MTPGDSDFPLPFPKSPQTATHARGSPPASSGRPRDKPAAPASARASVGSPRRGGLSSGAGHGAPPPHPRHSLSRPPLQAPSPGGRARTAVGARTASLAASAIAYEPRRRSTYGSCRGSEVPGPSPQASRPAQPGSHSGRSGPGRAPRKWASDPDGARPAPRCRPGTASGITHSGLHRSAPPRVRSGLTCPAR